MLFLYYVTAVSKLLAQITHTVAVQSNRQKSLNSAAGQTGRVNKSVKPAEQCRKIHK